MEKNKLTPDFLLNKLKEEGVSVVYDSSPAELKTEILKHISGGRSKTGADGEHDRWFIKSPVIELE